MTTSVVRPETIDEAVGALSAWGDGLRPWAGGTALAPAIRASGRWPQRLLCLDRVLRLRRVEEEPGGGLRLGAMLTMHDLATSTSVLRHAPLLARAARALGNERIRRVATLGGHLAAADPAFDLPPVLLVLGTHVRLVSSRGERSVDLERLSYEPAAPDELLCDVLLPVLPPGTVSDYHKFAPTGGTGIVTVAASITFGSADRIVRRVGLAAAGAGPRTLRLANAEEQLVGEELNTTAARKVAALAAEEVNPVDDLRASAEYRRELIEVWTARLLERSGGGGGSP